MKIVPFDLDLEVLCPKGCHTRVAPLPPHDPGAPVFWYACPECGAEWSARVRNGRPDSIVLMKRSSDPRCFGPYTC
jgi:hypothetical protein